MVRILLIDDDPQIHKTLKLTLDTDYLLLSAYSGEQGLTRLQEEDPDIVLLDIAFPQSNGIEFLRRIVRLPAAPPVIMLTAHTDLELVVEAMKAGAQDYIAKPYTMKKLLVTIHQALQDSNNQALDETEAYPALTPILGESFALKQTKTLIRKYAPVSLPILIEGESGTGKELIAKAVHQLSGRKGPFLAINCGAIPDTLLESELFGTTKGAYTDAKDRSGVFEKAHTGTLFLDEIGELSLHGQVKLLRVLEEKEVSRLGGNDSLPVDVRIVSATNRDLKALVKKGDFREDLFFRISCLPMQALALRSRKEDIPLLATFFIQQMTNGTKQLSPEALQKLLQYDWPGNVRELKNVIERATVLCESDKIASQDIQV
jgi:DNA-binding NtrC family response regulator